MQRHGYIDIGGNELFSNGSTGLHQALGLADRAVRMLSLRMRTSAWSPCPCRCLHLPFLRSFLSSCSSASSSSGRRYELVDKRLVTSRVRAQIDANHQQAGQTRRATFLLVNGVCSSIDARLLVSSAFLCKFVLRSFGAESVCVGPILSTRYIIDIIYCVVLCYICWA